MRIQRFLLDHEYRWAGGEQEIYPWLFNDSEFSSDTIFLLVIDEYKSRYKNLTFRAKSQEYEEPEKWKRSHKINNIKDFINILVAYSLK